MSHVGQVGERYGTRGRFVAGALRDATGGGTSAVVDPATGRTVRTYGAAQPADVDAAVAAAKAPLPERAGAAPAERAEAPYRLARPVADRAEDFAGAESLQRGRPIRPSSGFDGPGAVDDADFFAGAARHLEGRAAAEYGPDRTSFVRREPVGVVGSIAPWHHPLRMAAWQIPPAAGDTVVREPSGTPRSPP